MVNCKMELKKKVRYLSALRLSVTLSVVIRLLIVENNKFKKKFFWMRTFITQICNPIAAFHSMESLM